MRDTIDPHGSDSRASGPYGRRTRLVAAPALVTVALTAGALAGGTALALAPRPHAAAAPQGAKRAERPAHPGHAAQPSHAPSHATEPSHAPSHRAQQPHAASQGAQESHAASQGAQESHAVSHKGAQQPHAASHEGAQRSREAQGGHRTEAQGGHRAQGAALRLLYDRPEAAPGGSGVIWRWTVANDGSSAAEDVVATQKITSGHKILGLSKPCGSDHETVVCRYETLGAGDKRTGWIKTSGNLKGGPLRVDAKMTWHRRPAQAAAPDAGTETGGHHPGH